MSHRFRILMLIAFLILTVSAMGSAIPLRSISDLLKSAVSGSASTANGREARLRLSSNSAPQVQTYSDAKLKQGEQFTIYRATDGQVVCRSATTSERREMGTPDLVNLGMKPINHLEMLDKTHQIQPAAAPNLTIVLVATQQLQDNQAASAAFTKAAQNWEAIIKSPVTIYIKVDYGATRFGQTWPSGVLGSTSAPGESYPYHSVRTNLLAEATGEGNATKQAIFNGLPAATVPTDLGDAVSAHVTDSTARAIGLLPATAQASDNAASIAFNSNFSFDFDPSDGITVGQIDFDAVATHEIGHALGFHSEAGLNVARPSVWDLYRFRTGVTTGSFTTAQRILTIGGSPDPLQFYFVPGNAELGLSTGGPTGSMTNGGDGWQSSHWKHALDCSSYIGIMDPAIPSGCRRVITSSDMLALTSFGYNLTNNNPPPPPPSPPAAPANDNFADAQIISSCSGTVTGTNFSATSESGEPSHDPNDATSLSPSRSVWYQWQAPSAGSVTITTAGSDFDTILAVYTGSTVGGLSQIVFNDDVQSGVIVSSSVTFTANAGTVYRIAIDGWGSDQGGIKLNWTGCAAPTPTPTPAPTPTATPTPTPTPTPVPTPLPGTDQIVISQLYASGGTAGATYQNSFVEVFNRGTNTVNLNSWIFQFGSETGVISNGVSFTRTNGILIQPGQYLLLQLSGGGSGSPLPSPDLSTGQVSASLTGKVLLTRLGVPFLGGSSCPLPNSGISDLLGYGANANCSEGTAPAPFLTNKTALIRKGGGCTDTDNNANDFEIGAPVPRNTSSPFNLCSGNPIDKPDFFVKQHYLDFLGRQPDQSGWDFWTNQITSCGSNAQCIEVRRIDVSASFFLSIEFQNNGYLVERFYKVAYGDATGTSTLGSSHPLAVPRVRFNEFLQGTQRIGQGVIVLAPGWEQLLETNKQAFALEFVQTSRFINAFPATMTPTQFVDKLNQNAGNVLSAEERTTAINLFGIAPDSSNTTARAQAVRQIADDGDLYNAEYNRAFVLAEYFGYLRRNPNDAPESTLDYTGYDFWLTKLNQFNGNYINAEMVKAFLSSIEYRQRFGP